MNAARPAILGGPPASPAGPPAWPLFDPAVAESVAAAMADGSWGRYLGPHCDHLREALAEFHSARHAHLCASGTAAVELALRGLGVGPGDEVILAAYDFEANFKNLLALGATPVLVDVRPDDAQIDLDRLEEAASDKTRAVLVSHLHGGIVDMPRLRDLADRRGWGVLEDACQMPGTIVAGRRAGMWGDAAALSFGGSKLLTAGRGGCVITNRDDVLQRIRLHTQRGNDLSPLSELQAAALLPQLPKLDERRATRTRNVSLLRILLANMPALAFFPSLDSRFSTLDSPDFYKLPLWYTPEALSGLPRETFAAAVRAEGVSLWPAFRGLHRTHSRRRFRTPGDLPNADAADQNLLVLHHPVLLADEPSITQVAAAIRKVAHFAAEIRDTIPPPAYHSPATRPPDT